MRILVTNDDGFGAEGLEALADSLSREHEVCIFAPDGERSGVSHALTLGGAGRVRKIRENAYSCSGTPADCVILAMLGAVGFRPELVVSGINRGPNLGTDILYSGTCAAARQAVLSGIPGIAVSCAALGRGLRYGASAGFVSRNLVALAAACAGQAFVNVNAPSSDEEPRGALWSLPCRRDYDDVLQAFDGPDGIKYCFLTGGNPGSQGETESDYSVVGGGRVSVSLILAHPQVPVGFPSGREFR
jgi:5'-nucleotidase